MLVHHHSELQRLLAFYENNKDEAKDLLFTNWNFEEKFFWNKGIVDAFKKTGFDSFYETYLNNRKNTLEYFTELIVNHKDNEE